MQHEFFAHWVNDVLTSLAQIVVSPALPFLRVRFVESNHRSFPPHRPLGGGQGRALSPRISHSSFLMES